MKKMMLKAAPAVLAMLLLAGCFEDRPSDNVAEPVIRKQAETDLENGLKIVDLQRSNGQVDPDSANRYKVTYDYRLQLTKPYAEVVLAIATRWHTQWKEEAANPSPSFMGIAAMQTTMEHAQYGMLAEEWINAQGDGFDARRDNFVGNCAPCRVFWDAEDAPDEAELRRTAYILGWRHLEDKQFEDAFQVGDGVERQAWSYFEKTEKGWVPSN